MIQSRRAFARRAVSRRMPPAGIEPPLLVYGDIPGHEIEHPLAVVIVGGLVTSAFVNLFAVPVLYLRFGRSPAARATAPAAGRR